MRRQFSIVLLLVAGLLATGSEWDLVQAFAWGRMIAGYSREMSFEQAVAKTFTPETMCPICHAVATAKQESAKDPAVPAAKPLGRIALVCAPTRVVVFDSNFRLDRLIPALPAPASAERPAPPSPPPRSLA
ncbi:MAG TPA: hypothetical protein VHE13_16580 [Opitutus sp.]|nr:hypothetical protein [Opitutus sp.]